MKGNLKTDDALLTPTEQDSEVQAAEVTLDELTPEQRRLVIQHYEERQIYHGPLPPATELIKYNEAQPNAAGRIITMAEKEQAARLENESYALKQTAKAQTRGQYMGFFGVAIVLITGATLLLQGRAIEGFVTLVGSAGALGLIFIGEKSRGSDKNEEEQ